MRKNFFYVFLIGYLAIIPTSTNQAINTPHTSTAKPPKEIQFFQGSWNALLVEAKKQNKPFWVDIYTTWCAPCTQMSKTTFTDVRVGKIANKKFLSYKLDAEKGEGRKISAQYNVDSYPTILFFDADGKLLGREEGFQDAERFAQTLDKYRKKAKEAKK